MKILLIFLIPLLFISGCFEDKKINAICKWTPSATQTESFAINLSKNKVIWVEEEIEMPIDEDNDGFIKFSGVKSRVGISTEYGYVSEKNLPVNFKINKVDGSFEVVTSRKLEYEIFYPPEYRPFIVDIDKIESSKYPQPYIKKEIKEEAPTEYLPKTITPSLQPSRLSPNTCTFDKEW